MSANRTSRSQHDASVIAVIHRAGRAWRCLTGRFDDSRALILDQRDFTNDQAPRIGAWLDTQRAGRVIMVLPASAVICRTCPLPAAAAEQLIPALQLQAETHLLGQVPPHRTGLAVLHASPGETTRTGIVLAWPESARVEWPPVDRPVTFAPDVAAIAAMLDGLRPSEPILWADRRDGSVALAITHSSGATFRATREDAVDDDAWRANIARVVAETALGAGHGGPFVDALVNDIRQRVGSGDHDGGMLLLPTDLVTALNQRLAGQPRDNAWWSHWGIAVGVLLATADQLAPLTRLLDQPPLEKPSRIADLAERLARPRTATIAAVVCLAALAISPLLFSGAKLFILNTKVPDLESHQANMIKAQAQLVVYQELLDRAWPMSKLLSDVACCTPDGIDVQTITMAFGQEIHVSGTAAKKGERSAKDVVINMGEQMRKTGIFDDIRIKWGTTDNFGNKYDFDLFASVKAPYREGYYSDEQDFGKRSLADRLYGPKTSDGAIALPSAEPISETPANGGEPQVASVPPPDEGDETSEDRDGSRVTSSSTGDSNPFPSVSGRDDGPMARPVHEIPPALTQSQIDAMDRPGAQAALRQIAMAMKSVDSKSDDFKRLSKEFKQVNEHMRKLPK